MRFFSFMNCFSLKSSAGTQNFIERKNNEEKLDCANVRTDFISILDDSGSIQWSKEDVQYKLFCLGDFCNNNENYSFLYDLYQMRLIEAETDVEICRALYSMYQSGKTIKEEKNDSFKNKMDSTEDQHQLDKTEIIEAMSQDFYKRYVIESEPYWILIRDKAFEVVSPLNIGADLINKAKKLSDRIVESNSRKKNQSAFGSSSMDNYAVSIVEEIDSVYNQIEIAVFDLIRHHLQPIALDTHGMNNCKA